MLTLGLMKIEDENVKTEEDEADKEEPIHFVLFCCDREGLSCRCSGQACSSEVESH